MNNNDPVLDRIENAERMLRQARTEHQRGNAEDAAEFLAAARRNIDRASEAMKAKATEETEVAKTFVLSDQQNGACATKVAEVITHRREVAHAR